MLGKIFGTRPTTRGDVVMAFAGALFGAMKAYDTTVKYRAEQKANLKKENHK